MAKRAKKTTKISPEQLVEAHRLIELEPLTHLDGNSHEADRDALRKSMGKFGQFESIVVWRDEILIGNNRVAVAREDGETHLAGYDLSAFNLSEAERLGRAIASNRIAQLGRDDPRLLADLINKIDDVKMIDASGFDLEALPADLATLVDIDGYSPPELDMIDYDDVESVIVDDPQTKRGDVLDLGRHRLLCGDCRKLEDVELVLDGRKINVGFTSPPYADRREYDESSGFEPINPDVYVEWFRPVSDNVEKNLAVDGSWFVNIRAAANGIAMETYVLELVLAHAREWGWIYAAEFCWERNGIPVKPTRRFKNQFEPIFHFAQGEWKFRPEAVRHHSDKVPLTPGVGGSIGVDRSLAGNQGRGSLKIGKPRSRPGTGTGQQFGVSEDIGATTVEGLAYPGNRLPTFAGSHEAVGHSAAFPVGLPEWFVKAYSDEDDVIFDPFLGSGSTLLAAHKTGRVGVGMEISPSYCDLIAARFERITGITPKVNGKKVSFT